jgi:DNA-binding CsgD family transcriptional regulator
MLARAQGDVAGAWQRVREVLPQGPLTEPGDMHFLVGQEMQRLAVAQALDDGDRRNAKEWLAAHDRWLAWNGAVLGRAEGHALWAQYHRQSGDSAQAFVHAEHALASASDPRQPLALLAAHRLLGELHTDAGDFDAAASHLATSLALADACTAPYERAQTLLALAALHGAHGDSAQALAPLAEAASICTTLGARPTLARIAALRERLTATPSSAYPAGLSAREVEVLRLVAQGMTDRQVAEQLFLSPRTINQHLRSIYNKLGVSTRAAATAFAYDHRLAGG